MKSSLLYCMILSLTCSAPAYSLPLTPDQVMIRADQELEDQFKQEVEELEVIFNDLALTDAKVGKTTHRLYLKGKYNEEAITLFVNNLAKANWDVYDNHAADIRVLKIVRHNTIPE